MTVPDQPGLADTSLDRGLTAQEAEKRLARYGENAIAEKKTHPVLKFLSYFWGPIPWMIEAAALLSAVVQHWADLAVILLLLCVNAGVGFWQESRADNAIALLRRRLAPTARVLRDGLWKELPAKEVVPGDVVLVRLGNILPADLKLVDGEYLSVDQSALTGESLPVDKKVGDVAYSGSIARRGEMKAIVTATGMNTYFGKTAKLVETAATTSHFQRAVLRIGNFLIIVTLGLVVVILAAAFLRHDPLLETVQFALVLTVAAIPVAMHTAPPGASIDYTTNGPPPTQSPTPTSGTITLTNTAAIRAAAFESGYNPSAQAIASFTVTQPFDFSVVQITSRGRLEADEA